VDKVKIREFLTERNFTILKFINLGVIVILFAVGEYYKKSGGHPVWYWFALAFVVVFGLTLVITNIVIRKKNQKPEQDKKQEGEDDGNSNS